MSFKIIISVNLVPSLKNMFPKNDIYSFISFELWCAMYIFLRNKPTDLKNKQTKKKQLTTSTFKKNTSNVVLSDNTKISIRKQSKEFLPGKKCD